MTFGRGMLEHWLLDPSNVYLNHGTVGATPRRVLRTQQALRDEMERQPSQFMLRELNGEQPMPGRTISRLREASAAVAGFVGADTDDLVLVSNVTTAMNAVLGSFPLASGDEILMTDLAYGAITNTARVACDRAGATLRIVTIAYPPRDPGEVVKAIAGAITARTKLVVIDHITARTALVLPVAEIAAVCHARGVPVLVDGAHAPGAIPVDIRSLGVDWYGANLHKWAHAPRSCGFLWAAPERQAILHAPVVSWGRDKGFLPEFEHTPTTDPTSLLAAPDGIALLREWNFDACVDYMHRLALDAATLLTEAWGRSFDVPTSMVGTMVTVPLPPELGSTDADATRLRLALLVEDRIEVQLHAAYGRLWIRVSAQVYNDRTDLQRLGDAVAKRCAARQASA
jgi:isopenicillin-N epimerase